MHLSSLFDYTLWKWENAIAINNTSSIKVKVFVFTKQQSNGGKEILTVVFAEKKTTVSGDWRNI